MQEVGFPLILEMHSVPKSPPRVSLCPPFLVCPSRDSLYVFRYMKLQKTNLECFYFSLIVTYYCALSNLPSLPGGQKMNRSHSFLFAFSY